MAIIENYEVDIVEYPLREVFKTALREVSSISVIRLTINGMHRGESVETKAITGDTVDLILKDLSETMPKLVGESDDVVVKDLPISQSAKSTIDMALTSLRGEFQSGATVKTDVTIPVAPIEALPAIVASRGSAGFDSFKIKFAREPLDLLIRKMVAVKDLAPTSSLRVDPNQSWDIELTSAFLMHCGREGIAIDYIEQPTPARDFEALAEIRKRSSVLVMADESCFTAEDLHALIESDAIDYVNLKLIKNGGIQSLLEIAKIAQDASIKISVGSMMESSLGVSYAARLAAHLEPDFTHDLDAAWWLKDSPITYNGGYLIDEGVRP